MICLDWVFEFRFKGRTLAGPRVPSSFTAQLTVHSAPPRNARILLLVKQAQPGKPWLAVALDSARPGEEACVNVDRLREAGLSGEGARRHHEKACYLME
jgi:hypothetical protein